MKKLIILSMFISSCSSNLNYISNNKSETNYLKIENKFSSDYLKNIIQLRKSFLNSTEGKVRSSYIDENNNILIIFDNTMYYIDSNGYTKTYDLKNKPYNTHNALLYLNKGNGFGFFNSELTTSTTYVVDFKLFEPQDNTISSNLQTSLLYIDNKKNGISYKLLDDNRTMNLYKVNNLIQSDSLVNSFTLNENEQFYQNYFFNRNGKGFIFSEKYIDIKRKNRMYLFENNKIDINNPIDIKFQNIDETYYYISGKIDDNGNGFLYGQNINNIDKDLSENYLEIKNIFNYKLQEKSYLFKNIKNPQIFINTNGNGFIVSVLDNKNIHLYTINNYKIIKTNKILDNTFESVNVNLNDNGNGFIIINYSNLTNTLSKYHSNMILIENYNILEI
jgi:hypothetical protein